MTKQDRTRYLSIPGAMLALGALLFWLLNTAFVSQREYDVDVDRIERKLDCALWDLPRGCRDTMAPRLP